MAERDPSAYAWWLASRAAGIVAFVLIASAVMLGLFMAARIARRPGQGRILVKVHEQIALAAIAAIVLHGALLLGDPWLHPGLSGVLVPFTISYRPAWTGLGIFAGYLAVILGPTYYLRRRIGARRWRQIHKVTVVVYVLALIHALVSGTDGASLWFRTLAALTLVPIAILLPLRYRRSARLPAVRSQKPPRARRSAPAQSA